MKRKTFAVTFEVQVEAADYQAAATLARTVLQSKRARVTGSVTLLRRDGWPSLSAKDRRFTFGEKP